MSPGAGHLVAEVDVRVEVTDHVGRRTAGRLVGTAQRLRLDVTDPAVVVAASGRDATHGLAARLAAAGVRAELHGPRGQVAVIDPERASRVGALLTGSPHVTLTRAGWALPAQAFLPPGAGTMLAGTAAALLAAGVLVSGRAVRRGRSRSGPRGRARPARRARPRRSPWG